MQLQLFKVQILCELGIGLTNNPAGGVMGRLQTITSSVTQTGDFGLQLCLLHLQVTPYSRTVYPKLLNISSEFQILFQMGMPFRWTLSTLEKEQEMLVKN